LIRRKETEINIVHYRYLESQFYGLYTSHLVKNWYSPAGISEISKLENYTANTKLFSRDCRW